MDERILKAILSSSDTVIKKLEHSTDYKRLMQENKFLPTSNDIFDALSSSLTNLLSYKVSKEAYQRYSVRLHIIGVLREWCRINDTFQKFKALRDEEQTLRLLKTLLEKYLTDDVLNDCDSSAKLLSLTSALMCLSCNNSDYKRYLEKVLGKLTELEPCDQSEYLLCYAVEKNSNFNLEISVIEKIYGSQKYKLIEQPLLNDYMSSCAALNKDDLNKSERIHSIDQLLDFATKSSHIFLLVCGCLKEFLVQLDYATTVADFIQLILKRIKESCDAQCKDILDLYPRNLQSLIILLRIEPIYHTDDSKNATLKTLENIYTEDKDTVIALLSHYPKWLKLFGDLLCASDIR